MTNDADQTTDAASVEKPLTPEPEIKPLRETRVRRCIIPYVAHFFVVVLAFATIAGLYFTIDTWLEALVTSGVFLCGIAIGLHIVFHHLHLRFIDILHLNQTTHQRHAQRLKRVLNLSPEQTAQAAEIFRRRMPEFLTEAAPVAHKHFWTLYNDVHLILNQEQRERHEFMLRELARHLRIDLDRQ